MADTPGSPLPLSPPPMSHDDKLTRMLLGAVVGLIVFLTVVMVAHSNLDATLKGTLLAGLGMLFTKLGTFIDYMLGSSKGSTDKNNIIASLHKETTDAKVTATATRSLSDLRSTAS